MDIVTIINDNFKIYIHFKNNKIYGYKFNKDNTFEEIDNSVLEFFNFIKLSNNNTKIDNYKGYEVYLDNETNFKHYLRNGLEDYSLFFYNNSEDAVSYNIPSKKSNTRVFYYKRNRIYLKKKRFYRLVRIILALTLITSTTLIATNINKKDNIVKKLTIEDIQNYIYSSPNIKDEDKEYLYNEELLELVLPMVNETNSNRYLYSLKFKDIDLVRYEREEDSTTIGWYNMANPNIINIDAAVDDNNEVENIQYLNSYTFINKNYMYRNDTIAHEFIHLCQTASDFHFLKESCAEILSTEFYSYTKTNHYLTEVRLTKKLMEIIGPYPILYFNFTDDFSLIEKEVKPFLTEEEYDSFCFFLRSSSCHTAKELFDVLEEELDKLLNKLYYNRYGKEASSDPVIYALDNNKPIIRYYFNPKHIYEESYYCDNELDFKEAFDTGLMKITYRKKGSQETPFKTFEEYTLFDEDPDYDIKISFAENTTVSGCKVICNNFCGIIRYLTPIGDKDFTPRINNKTI